MHVTGQFVDVCSDPPWTGGGLSTGGIWTTLPENPYGVSQHCMDKKRKLI